VHPNVSCVPLSLSSLSHPELYLRNSCASITMVLARFCLLILLIYLLRHLHPLTGKTWFNLPFKPCNNRGRVHTIAHTKMGALTPSTMFQARSWPRYLYLARNLRKRGKIRVRPPPDMLYDALLKYRSNITLKLTAQEG